MTGRALGGYLKVSKESDMRFKQFPSMILATLFVCAAFPAHPQSVPAAERPLSPLAVGLGFSAYNPDYDHGHLLGTALWIDYTPKHIPKILWGLGIEAEARDMNFGRSPSQPPNLRQDIAEGGLLYSCHYFRNIQPYAKYLVGFGNTDETARTGLRYHDSRTTKAIGGGVDFKSYRKIWVRVDYEYQSWPNFFKHTNPAIPAGQLNPQGVTIGAIYRF
jgi:opacity protein-like surface antigen